MQLTVLGGDADTLRGAGDAAPLLRAAISSLTGVSGADAAFVSVNTSSLVVDSSYLRDGANISTLLGAAAWAGNFSYEFVTESDPDLNAPIDPELYAQAGALLPQRRLLQHRVLQGVPAGAAPNSSSCTLVNVSVPGLVVVKASTVALRISLPLLYLLSTTGSLPTAGNIIGTATSIRSRMVQLLANRTVMQRTLAGFKTAWANCTGLAPAALEGILQPAAEPLLIITPALAAAAAPTPAPQRLSDGAVVGIVVGTAVAALIIGTAVAMLRLGSVAMLAALSAMLMQCCPCCPQACCAPCRRSARRAGPVFAGVRGPAGSDSALAVKSPRDAVRLNVVLSPALAAVAAQSRGAVAAAPVLLLLRASCTLADAVAMALQSAGIAASASILRNAGFVSGKRFFSVATEGGASLADLSITPPLASLQSDSESSGIGVDHIPLIDVLLDARSDSHSARDTAAAVDDDGVTVVRSESAASAAAHVV